MIWYICLRLYKTVKKVFRIFKLSICKKNESFFNIIDFFKNLSIKWMIFICPSVKHEYTSRLDNRVNFVEIRTSWETTCCWTKRLWFFLFLELNPCKMTQSIMNWSKNDILIFFKNIIIFWDAIQKKFENKGRKTLIFWEKSQKMNKHELTIKNDYNKVFGHLFKDLYIFCLIKAVFFSVSVV